ncbi:MAG: RsmE family RNA methyltransferase [Planctomycetota bacterium]
MSAPSARPPRSPRLFVPEGSAYEGREAVLPPDEARHAATVLRAKAGDAVELFDGAGRRVAAELAEVGKRRVVVRAVGEPTETPAPDRPFTLAVAAPKGDRFRWLVEKATELGVDRLRLVTTERSVVEPGGGKLDKAAAAVIAACKQCGRDRLMPIEAALPFGRYVVDEASDHRVIAVPTADEPLSAAGGPTACLIGPEGGFTDAEVDTAVAAGWEPVSLGRHVLRVETAAVAAAAVAAAAD